ncbi:MAG: dihydroorotase [Pirellulales bacterium]
MAKILIENGRVIDPSQSLDRVANLLLADGKIAAIDLAADAEQAAGAERIDAAGLIVAPGLIDMHVHLREPGGEDDETVRSGCAAAVAGGFTSIACMPDTDPPIDSQATVEFVRHQAEQAGLCNVYVVACLSKNRQGEELAEIGQLVQAGAIAFSDSRAPISNPELMRRALEYCLMFGKPVLNHCEARELTHGGVMHEGLVSMTLALAGMPAAAEDVMTSRDISLAEITGGVIHLQHLSSAGSVEMLRRAKNRGVRVSAEICPQQFTLTDESLRTFDSNYKVNPPLRGAVHVQACIEGLIDGTIDCICSDHSPHAVEKKMRELDQAPFGIVGLETTLALVISKLVVPGRLDWSTAIAKLTSNPARVLGIDKGTLKIGADADVTLIDPAARWTVDPVQFQSQSRNTPFAGRQLTGRAHTVIVGGEVKHKSAVATTS